MKTLKNLALGSAATLATLGVITASGLLIASPAAADTTGYQTGYAYNQGLASGAGGALSANYTGTGDVVAADTAAQPATVNAPADQTTTYTTTTEEPVNAVYTDGTQASVPATVNAANTAAPSYFDFSSPLMWLALVVLLAIIGLAVAALSREPQMTTSEYY